MQSKNGHPVIENANHHQNDCLLNAVLDFVELNNCTINLIVGCWLELCSFIMFMTKLLTSNFTMCK